MLELKSFGKRSSFLHITYSVKRSITFEQKGCTVELLLLLVPQGEFD